MSNMIVLFEGGYGGTDENLQGVPKNDKTEGLDLSRLLVGSRYIGPIRTKKIMMIRMMPSPPPG